MPHHLKQQYFLKILIYQIFENELQERTWKLWIEFELELKWKDNTANKSLGTLVKTFCWKNSKIQEILSTWKTDKNLEKIFLEKEHLPKHFPRSGSDTDFSLLSLNNLYKTGKLWHVISNCGDTNAICVYWM